LVIDGGSTESCHDGGRGWRGRQGYGGGPGRMGPSERRTRADGAMRTEYRHRLRMRLGAG